jgi:hypothetical protein
MKKQSPRGNRRLRKQGTKMIIRLTNPRVQLENNRKFITRRHEKVASEKIYTIKDIMFTSSLIFSAGITCGVAIMQLL